MTRLVGGRKAACTTYCRGDIHFAARSHTMNQTAVEKGERDKGKK